MRISRTKRRVFKAVLFVMLCSFLEILSFGAFRLREGRWYSWSTAAQIRNSAGSSSTKLSLPVDTSATGAVHPYVGCVMPPNWEPNKMNMTWGEELTNHPCDGFPSFRPVVQKRSPNTVIIGLFGGSVAEIFYYQGIPVLLEKLKEDPKYRGREFVVVCMATGGFKQPQQLMALNYLLVQGGELDVLINVDGFNEVAFHASGNQKQGVFPIYPRSWAARVGQIRDPHVLKLYGQAAILESDLRENGEFFSSVPMYYSPTCHLLWRATNQSLIRRLQAAKVDIENDHERDELDRPGFGYHPSSEEEVYEELVGIWESSSRLIGELCAANAIQYYHFLQPNQYVEGSKPMGDDELQIAFREDHPYREGVTRGYPLLRQAGERLALSGENFTDLTDAFRETQESVYIDDCCHFSDLGNRILAERIAEAILKSPN
ncbi:MAG: hypothetical protein R3C02_00135 [Planctomycetaceae bacterium]